MVKYIFFVLVAILFSGCLSVSGSLKLGDTAKIAELKKPRGYMVYDPNNEEYYEDYAKFGIRKPEIYRQTYDNDW